MHMIALEGSHLPNRGFNIMMTHRMARPAFLTLCFLLAATAAAQPAPLLRAHAHNDYVHSRPLLDALELGFTSIEVDIHLKDGALLVGHDDWDLEPGRTLQGLYLEPLAARTERQGGRLFAGDAPLQLLVDIKTEADETYAVLKGVLASYALMLTRYEYGRVVPGAVTVVLSGNRPRSTLEAEPLRFAFYDGRLDDLEVRPPAPASFMPLVSANWRSVFPGGGIAPDDTALQRIRETVARAHAQGKKVRFWATPDDPRLWEVLLREGVDYINADDLAGLHTHLQAR